MKENGTPEGERRVVEELQLLQPSYRCHFFQLMDCGHSLSSVLELVQKGMKIRIPQNELKFLANELQCNPIQIVLTKK